MAQALAKPRQTRSYETINNGFNSTFAPGQLSVGLVVPIESYPHSAVPTMQDHVRRVQLAEQLGFRAVWLRDVPFNVPRSATRARSTTRSSIWGCSQQAPQESHSV